MAVSMGAVFLAAATAVGASRPAESLADASQQVFGDMRPGGSGRTPRMLAPNKHHVVWSVVAWERTADVFHTAVVLRDTAAGGLETGLRPGLNKAGRLVGPDGKVRPPANADQLCVVDWSRDSRSLLVREIVGRTESDNTIIRAADRWRGIQVGEFEQQQLRALREELDPAHTQRGAPAAAQAMASRIRKVRA